MYTIPCQVRYFHPTCALKTLDRFTVEQAVIEGRVEHPDSRVSYQLGMHYERPCYECGQPIRSNTGQVTYEKGLGSY